MGVRYSGTSQKSIPQLILYQFILFLDRSGNQEAEDQLMGFKEPPTDIGENSGLDRVNKMAQPFLQVIRLGGLGDSRIEQLLHILEGILVHRVNASQVFDHEEQ